jgi:AraC family transcriptional regulator
VMSKSIESTHAQRETMCTHRHSAPYAALVLDGFYEELSIDGRFACSTGVLTIHPAWHSHANHFGSGGAKVLNLPIPEVDGLTSIKVSNAREIEKLARRCPASAGMAVLEETQEHAPLSPAPWLSALINLIVDEPQADIASLAVRCGVTPEHASRACKRWFGQGPVALRRDGRIRRAISLLHCGATPTEAAFEAGFSDQPHLTRLLKRETGLTPATFRQA